MTGLQRTAPIARKRAKPRKRKAPGTACQHWKRCRRNQTTTVAGRRLCPLHAADALFSAVIRAREVCEVAPWFPAIRCNGELQCSHLVGRSYHSIAWDETNAVCSCAAHHVYTTNHPLEWQHAISEHHRPTYELLRWHALTWPVERPVDVIARYQPIDQKEQV